MKNWYYSFVLLFAYLGIFHLWMHVGRNAIIISGLVVCLTLTAMLVAAHHRRYFLNNYDSGAHIMVILDILLEAILPIIHDHYGFYLCALAFTVVIGGYRRKLLKNRTPEMS